MARLAWWISFGAFLTAGGLQAISAGLIDSVRSMPIGSLLSGGGMPDVSLADLAVRFPAAALALAITLAIPALVAVLAFHLTTAICLRTVPFAPGAGLLQALAALVLLGAVYLGADAWAGGFGSLIQAPLEQCFDLR
jgi:flagellar biosynthesis protein FliR